MTSAHTPAGPPAEQISDGFAAIAPAYDRAGREFFGPMAAALITRAGLAPGMNVLDLGCGTGTVTLAAAQATGPTGTVHGLDSAGPMLAQARTRTRRAGLDHVTFTQADAAEPPFPPGSFHVLTAGYLIQLLTGPSAALARWHTLLRPGGTLAFSWGLAQDPAWQPVMDAVDLHLPRGVAGFDAVFRRPPFTSAEALETLMAARGYQAVTTTTCTTETVYPSPEAWWDASMNQAPGVLAWRYIYPGRRPAAQHDAYEAMRPLRQPDGTYRRTLTMAITTGRRPAYQPTRN